MSLWRRVFQTTRRKKRDTTVERERGNYFVEQRRNKKAYDLRLSRDSIGGGKKNRFQISRHLKEKEKVNVNEAKKLVGENRGLPSWLGGKKKGEDRGVALLKLRTNGGGGTDRDPLPWLR